MPCYSPQNAYRTQSGGVTFTRSRSLSGEKFTLPCGQCVGCRLERSRQWAMRCVHENKSWPRSCFITLTYDDDNLPPGGTLVKRDFQLFMKRLRKVRPDPVRFYACGEYGETTNRPHYHAILFNCDFPDKRLHSNNHRDEPLHVSCQLSSLWDRGHHLIGEVTFESAAYVARYCVKKITGPLADEHYCVYDADGCVTDRLPEFALMSRRPGIGSGYYARYGSELRDHDRVIVNNREVPGTRFYDNRTVAFSEKLFTTIRRKRKLLALRAAADNTVDRRRVKEIITLKRLKMSDEFRSQ